MSAAAPLKRRDFGRICARPPADRTPYYKLFTEASPAGQARLGVSISSRVGGAALRNRIRRRLKAAFRELRQLAAGTDAVIIVRPGIERLEYSALCRLLERSLSRAFGSRPGRSSGRTDGKEHHARDEGSPGSAGSAVSTPSLPRAPPVV
ncbi:MAG: ribonuclease P protein component [Nitrospinota bacterium]